MKAIILTLALLCAGSALAITAGEVSGLHDELLVLMDKYAWETYTNPYTGEVVTITTAERHAIKVLCIAKYNEHKAAVLQYATELGIIN